MYVTIANVGTYGSMLGPMICINCVNFSVSNIDCYHKIFADNLKLYLVFDHDDIHQNSSSLQQDINNLADSSGSLGLKMNNSKRVVMRFCSNDPDILVSGMSSYKINHEHIVFDDSYKDLGITVERTLKFHSHITKKVNILNGLTNNFPTCTLCRNYNFLMNHYISHIKPHLEYATSVWNYGF